MWKKSEIRNHANYGSKFLDNKSEIRDYAKYAANFFWKHLKYVITPITGLKNVDNNLKYVITGSLKKFQPKTQLRICVEGTFDNTQRRKVTQMQSV